MGIIRASITAACASFDGRFVPSRCKPAFPRRKAAEVHEELFACEGLPSNEWPAELEKAFRRFVRNEIFMHIEAVASFSAAGRSNSATCSPTQSGAAKNEPELNAKPRSPHPQVIIAEMKAPVKATYVPPHSRQHQAGQRVCPEMQLQQASR